MNNVGEIWLSKLEYANEHNLTMFVFWFDDTLYVPFFMDEAWSYPEQVDMI